MYWNRKAVTGQIDGFIKSNRKNCDGQFAGLMSWNRKAVTGKFDRLYYVETEKNCNGMFCRFNVLEQKSRDRAD